MENFVKPSYQGVSMPEAIKLLFKNYANFRGRSSRSEYWWVYLAQQIVFFPLCMAFQVLEYMVKDGYGITIGFAIIMACVGLFMFMLAMALLVPVLALACRRLHDIGKSGWWLFIDLIPIVGSIILIVWMIRGSDPGENEFGDTVVKD